MTKHGKNKRILRKFAKLEISNSSSLWWRSHSNHLSLLGDNSKIRMGSKTPIVRDVLYWPKHLRNKVKQTVQHFQQEELKRNLAKTDLRDVIIVCVAEAPTQYTRDVT